MFFVKYLLSIIPSLQVLTSLSYGEEKIIYAANRPKMLAGVIRDTTPASEEIWNMENAVNVEIVDALKNHERLIEWIAYPRKHVVLADTIFNDHDAEKNHIINGISNTSRELLFPADIVATMEREKEYRCFLIVICKGQMSDDQVSQIRRYAGAFRAKVWPVLEEVGFNLEASHPGWGQIFSIFVIADMVLAICILCFKR